MNFQKPKKFLHDMVRVWRVTRKPTKREYFLTFKVVLVGFIIIGLIGFVIEMVWQMLLEELFR